MGQMGVCCVVALIFGVFDFLCLMKRRIRMMIMITGVSKSTSPIIPVHQTSPVGGSSTVMY